MRPIAQWAHMMANSITVAPQTGVDGYGKATFGPSVTYRCHLTQGERLSRSVNGREMTAGVRAILMTNAAIAPTSRVTLSTGDVGSTEEHMIHPVLVSVDRRYDSTSANYTVLMLSHG